MSDRTALWLQWGLIGFSVLIAIISAQAMAGGWNDGSRLAAIESLGERGTFIIDDSIFVQVPPAQEGVSRPYKPVPELLNQTGTFDKLLIAGHFYSDKPPTVTVLLAGVHRAALSLGGPTAAERPDWFCWAMTFVSAGLPFVLAVVGLRQVGQQLDLPPSLTAMLLAGLIGATYAATYTWYVNNHVLFLAVTVWLIWALLRTEQTVTNNLLIGTLAGWGYGLDLALGPALGVALAVYLLMQNASWRTWLILGLASAPWLGLHHGLNYAVGGTFGPANSVPEYLKWPGSPFDERNMTGGWKHTPTQFVLYSLDLLFAKKGFFVHNLPLFLFPASAWLVGRYQPRFRPFVGFSLVWFGLGWMIYTAGSTNLSGACCSIRWFVPYLAPMLVLIAMMLKESPRYRIDFAWLTLSGLPIGALMWWDGPWTQWMVPGLWGWLGVALLGWLVIRLRDWRQAVDTSQPGESEIRRSA